MRQTWHGFSAAAIGLALLLAACAGRPAEGAGVAGAEADRIAAGQLLAEAQCAACHAVGPLGDSPNPAATPLRQMNQRVDLAVLETEFAEGMRVGHAEMPLFQFDLEGVDALLAYLRAIQETPN